MQPSESAAIAAAATGALALLYWAWKLHHSRLHIALTTAAFACAATVTILLADRPGADGAIAAVAGWLFAAGAALYPARSAMQRNSIVVGSLTRAEAARIISSAFWTAALIFVGSTVVGRSNNFRDHFLLSCASTQLIIAVVPRGKKGNTE